MRLITLDEIRDVVPKLDPLDVMEQAFIAYSSGKAVIPPVGELIFDDPSGDVHIKYGYLKGDDYYVVKIASGFYGNPSLGLPSSNGMMLLFDRRTGNTLAVILDEGYLTDVRTAAAGAVTVRHLGPGHIEQIGVIGSGNQARLQLSYISQATSCKRALVWGRTPTHVKRYQEEMVEQGMEIEVAANPQEVAAACRVIVTTTPSKRPLLDAQDVEQGTHIVAVGSDSSEKQELDAKILGKADLVVADSIPQCLERGEISHALRAGFIRQRELVELGKLISGEHEGRTSDEQITVADLTGVAVQDIAISKAVFEALARKEI